MAVFSKLLKSASTPKNTALLASSAAILWIIIRRERIKAERRKRDKGIKYVIGEVSNFLTPYFISFPPSSDHICRMIRILKILIPRFFCIETWYVILVAIALATRTFCDVWMIQNGTSIESAIIGQNMELFKTHLWRYIYAMPAYGLNELKLRFRTRFSNYLYTKYLRGFTYYQMTNLDNRISNADQLLTQDVEKFSESVGELYSNLSKINTSMVSEEIAFYQGNAREEAIVKTVFGKLVDHMRNYIFFRFSMGLVDNIIAKYIATLVGFWVVSRPFLALNSERHRHSTHSERLQSGRMLVKMAEAIGRVVLAGREMTRLAGFTQRITEFMKVLEDLNKGHYERTMVSTESNRNQPSLKPGSGRIIKEDKIIRFEKVPLITPNGDVLVKELNFEVKSGLNVLVCGPNGCGKSSLFRILGERPYMILGTLRDQIIYPDNKDDMLKKGVSDKQLQDILAKVQLSYILEREGGWDAVQDWMDVLSGGEKQRVAMARLFYNKPQFAILDECTSAVSVDVEGFMYQHCRSVGITLFTVSHRKSLWKHHEYYLHMDGRGSFEFKPITKDTVEFGS
ncbi:hypothetical protein LSH36_394g02081 [Paralvinella palmiformis]|uniref:ABC transporter domain-containing protein n=1 Tax=Paralvinella palmiformis TaxID=53620 RepID=A0AAD9JE62_9ANNE|nr:hypothetical protein LSH36_394g02081 [Paralvinella palmiformis]